MRLIVAVMFILWTGAVLSAPITSDEVRIIDGDTIRLHQQRPDVRLVGFNAPETRRAICESERGLDDKATRRLRDLMQSSKLDLSLSLVRVSRARKEHHPAITEGVAALSKQMVVTSALS